MRGAALIGGLLLTLAATAALGDERLALPGSRLSFELPEGFVLADDFPGFHNAVDKMDLVIGSFPKGEEDAAWTAADRVFQDLKAANTVFGDPNKVFTELETITTNSGLELRVIRGEMTAEGLPPLQHWLVLVGPEAAAPLTVDRMSDALDDAAVRKILASLEVAPVITMADRLAALPFAVDALDPFGTVTISADTALTLSPGPPETLHPINPIVRLVWEQLKTPSTAAEIAEPTLRRDPEFADAVIEESVPAPFAGTEGIRLSGTFVRAGIPFHFVQHNAVTDGWLVVMLATSPTEMSDVMEPIAETMAASVRAQ